MTPRKRGDSEHPGSDVAVRRIESPAHYHGAIGEALGRVKAAPGTVQEERLCALVEAIEEYEARVGHDIREDEKLSATIRRLRVSVGIAES
jgi:hypothetical protein